MPRMIVLNGPPAAGKSTIARRYVAEHPLALNLEIDQLRRQLGAWRDDPNAAGLLARDAALAAAGAHLRNGHDVVVPQYVGRVDLLARLAALGDEAATSYHEFVLMDTKDVMLERFRARTRAAAEPGHLEAQAMLDRFGGERQLEAMYDRLLLVIAARPHAQLVAAKEGKIDNTYDTIVTALDEASSRSTTSGA